MNGLLLLDVCAKWQNSLIWDNSPPFGDNFFIFLIRKVFIERGLTIDIKRCRSRAWEALLVLE
jgi:hypothetical protein